MLGPFKHVPFNPWTQISPLMTRPKRDSIERMGVVDLSFREGTSVNSGLTRGRYQGQRYKCTLHQSKT